MKEYSIIRRSLPAITLYLDDVEFVIAKITALREVIILAGGFELEAASELKELKEKTIRDLRVETKLGSEPLFSLDCTKYGCDMLLGGKNTSALRGVFEETFQFLKTKTNTVFRTSFWCSVISFLLFLVVSGLAGLSDRFLPKAFLIGVPIFIVLLASVSVASLLFTAYYSLNHHTTIILKYKSEAPSFWERKKDDLLLLLFSNIFVLVVGYVLGRLTHSK